MHCHLFKDPGVVLFIITITSNTEVTVTWDPPSQSSGVITGYQVIYSIYENDTSTMSDMLSGVVRSYLIRSLGKHIMQTHKYTFRFFM